MRPIMIAVACLLGAPVQAVELRPGQLELWTRQSAKVNGGEPGRERVSRIDLDALALRQFARADLQFGGALHTYRGVPVAELIARYAPPPSLDLALLHFANGMIVPLPFRDAAAMTRLDPWVARAMRHGQEVMVWRNEFPPVMKGGGYYRDARPIVFEGNKLVVADRWHPDVSARAAADFSPWAHVDALIGIELVEAAAYRAQFDVDPAPEVRAGLALFRGSCQFCHGARRVGAQFGWDFVEPVPIYTYRKNEDNLFMHLRYRATDAPEKGLMMPGLKFTTLEDARAILRWLRAVATLPLRSYQPPAQPQL